MHISVRTAAVACGALLLLAAPIAAQSPDTLITTTEPPATQRPAIGVQAGWASIENADGALEAGVFADIGSWRWPWLRTVIGLDYLNTTSTRVGADGSFTDVTLNLDLRIKPFRVERVVPYVGAGVGVHFRSSTATDPNVAAIYEGTAVGLQYFGGALVDLSADGMWGASGEVRSTQAQNVDRTTFRLGLFRRF